MGTKQGINTMEISYRYLELMVAHVYLNTLSHPRKTVDMGLNREEAVPPEADNGPTNHP